MVLYIGYEMVELWLVFCVDVLDEKVCEVGVVLKMILKVDLDNGVICIDGEIMLFGILKVVFFYWFGNCLGLEWIFD